MVTAKSSRNPPGVQPAGGEGQLIHNHFAHYVRVDSLLHINLSPVADEATRPLHGYRGSLPRAPLFPGTATSTMALAKSSTRITQVREQYPKRGVDRAHKPVAEIRFLPRLDGIDVRGPEEANAGKTLCE